MKYFLRGFFRRYIGNTDEKVHRILISAHESDDFSGENISEYPHKETLNYLYCFLKPGENFDETYLLNVDPMTLDVETVDKLLARGHFKIDGTVHSKSYPSVIIPLIDEITGKKEANIMLIFDTDGTDRVFCPSEWLREDASESACTNLARLEMFTRDDPISSE